MDLSLLPDYIAETGEHLDELETSLMLLEEDPENMDNINNVFRSIHSIKGSAEYMGVENTARLSHELENLLEIIRQGNITSENEIVETIIESRDRLAELTRELEEKQNEYTEVEDLIKRIRVFSIKKEDAEKIADDSAGRESMENSRNPDPRVAATGSHLSKIEDAFGSLKIILYEMTQGTITEKGKKDVCSFLDILLKYAGGLGVDKVVSKIQGMRSLVDTLVYPDEAGDVLADLHVLKSLMHDSGPDAGFSSASVSEKLSGEPGAEQNPGVEDEASEKNGEDESSMYDDESDEELFTIFIEHMKEKLLLISKLATSLLTTEDNTDILDNSLDLIESLKSSANYMDYGELVDVYGEWAGEIDKFQQNLFPDEDSDYQAFAKTGMQSYITRVIKMFPKHFDNDLIASAPEKMAETVADGMIDDGADCLRLPDEFDLETDVVTGCAATDLMDEVEAEAAEMENFQGLSDELDTVFEQPDDVLGKYDKRPEPFLGDMEKDLSFMGTSSDPGKVQKPVSPETRDRAEKTAQESVKAGGDGPYSPAERELGGKKLNGAQPTQEGELPTHDGELSTHEADIKRDETPVCDDKILTGNMAASEDEAGVEVIACEEDTDTDGDVEIIEAKGDLSSQRGKARFDGLGKKVVKQTMRVDSRKIDTLMNQAGELVVSRAGFAQLFSEFLDYQHYLQEHSLLAPKEMKQLKSLIVRLSESTVALGRVANELQEGVMKVRMLRIMQLFNRYPRLVRDLTHGTDKQITLEVKGEETELDKMVIEGIADPLVHIIRNCVDHGIETVAEREQIGKPKKGTIKLEAYHESNHVVILISDDGKGIDSDYIKSVAIKKNLLPADEVERMTRKDLMALIMRPGFSTADTVTKTSGRGVGMDVVKKNIEQLNGTIEIESKIGRGTRIRIKIPLTLAIIKALLVKVSGEIFTIPLATVEETLLVASNEISVIEGVEVIQLRDTVLSLLRLTDLFNLPSDSKKSDKAYVVVVNTGMRQVGIVVDALLGQEETVIKPLVDYLQENSGFSGATILGDGRISLILDVYELINLTLNKQLHKRGHSVYHDSFSSISFEGDSGVELTKTIH